MVDDFTTFLDYVLDDDGELAYLYHVSLHEVVGEIDTWAKRTGYFTEEDK